jgi:predicted small metal-binding protein
MLTCECGYQARGDAEDALIAAIQRHAWEAHAMALTHDDALLLAIRGELHQIHGTTAKSEPRPTPRDL